MKVTIVVGGRWHAFDLARELEQSGMLHRLITNYPAWFVSKWGIPKDKVISLQVTFWLIKAIYKVGGEKLMMRCQWFIHRWFAREAAKFLDGSDIIHGWSQWSEPSLKWARAHGVPTVLERSSAHILEQSELLRTEHIRHGFRWIETHRKIEAMELREYEMCTSIAVPSLFVERSFEKHKLPKEKVFKNHLGVNLSDFYPGDQIHPMESDNNFRIIYVGSLSLRKGIPDLLTGFRGANIHDATLTLVGGATEELDHLLISQPYRVIKVGHRPQNELVQYYRQSHCFVMASIEEGMAMVQMQALACGLPLVCTTNTGGEDLLRLAGANEISEELGVMRFPAGFLIPIHNPEAISYCLKRLSEDSELWKKMRKAAIETANSKLNWSNYGKRAIDHYSSLIKERQ